MTGYRVYRHGINEKEKTLKLTLKLWIRRKRGNLKLVCSCCGGKLEKAHDTGEREVRDLPCMEFRTTVVVEVYRVCCADGVIKVEKLRSFPAKLRSASALKTPSDRRARVPPPGRSLGDSAFRPALCAQSICDI